MSDKTIPDFSFEINASNNYHHIAGIDEAGRGPIAGPVVAAAVVFDSFDIEFIGINDSKKLNEKQRNVLYDEIISKSLSYGIGIVDNHEIDDINILNATMKAMKIAIDNLSLAPDFLLVDGNYFVHKEYKYQTIVKGDSKSISIAAASILAKVTRDRIMEGEIHSQYPLYSFDKHKGYGTKQHYRAIELFGTCEYHRMSFLKKLSYPVQGELFS